MLHRDIKPGNIIVGKHGETLVVDWGLATSLGRAEPGHSSGERTLMPSASSGSASTLPGSALGTPAYMSPEQAAGELDRLGPRSDVYVLGATLYCLLTGRPPYEGDDLGELIRKVQRGDSTRRHLVTLFGSGLERNPARVESEAHIRCAAHVCVPDCSMAQKSKSVAGCSMPNRLSFDATWPRW